MIRIIKNPLNLGMKLYLPRFNVQINKIVIIASEIETHIYCRNLSLVVNNEYK